MAIKSMFIATELIRHGGDPLAKLPNADEITGFVTEFYAQDIQFFEKVNSVRRARTAESRQVN